MAIRMCQGEGISSQTPACQTRDLKTPLDLRVFWAKDGKSLSNLDQLLIPFFWVTFKTMGDKIPFFLLK